MNIQKFTQKSVEAINDCESRCPAVRSMSDRI